jgi:hypothetical protein
MEMGTKPTRKEKNKVSQLKRLADIAKEKRNVGLIIVLLSLFYLLLTTYVWYSEKNILFHDKFKSLDLTLTEPAKVIKQKYGQKIVFKAIEYPKVEYYISGYTLDATDIVAIKSNLNKGSLVKLSVELDHFVSLKKNPSQTKTLSIYGLKDDKTEYYIGIKTGFCS